MKNYKMTHIVLILLKIVLTLIENWIVFINTIIIVIYNFYVLNDKIQKWYMALVSLFSVFCFEVIAMSYDETWIASSL